MILEGKFEATVELEEKMFRELVLVSGGEALYTVGKEKIEAVSGLIFPSHKVTLPNVSMVEICHKNEMSKTIDDFEQNKGLVRIG